MSALQSEIREALRAELKALVNDDGLLTWEESAKFLRVTTVYLDEIVERNKIRIHRHSPGGRRYLRKPELQAYLERIAEQPK